MDAVDPRSNSAAAGPLPPASATPLRSGTGETVHRHPLRYLVRHAWWLVGGILCLLATNALAQYIPWIVKRTVEAITQQAGPWVVAQHALYIAALAAGQTVVRIPSRIFIFNAAREAEYEVRGLLFERLVQASAGFYRRFRTGDLMSRLTNDLTSVRALFGPGVLHVTNTVFAYAIALPMMIRIDPWLTLWALLPYPVLLLGARYFARGIYSRSRALQVALAGMTTAVQENLAGIREMKLHRIEELRAEHFAHDSRRYLKEAIRLATWRAGLIPFVGLGSGASVVIVLWVGGAKVIADQLSLGDLVAMNLYVALLAWPTMSIGWILSLWQRGVASWHRLLDILDNRSELEVELAPAALPAGGLGEEAALHVELRGLSVALDGHEILHDVSCTIPQGSLCAVVGRVGSGKSTLAEALARLLEVPPGTVLFGGRDVTELPVQQVRGLIAYAPQHAFLFSATVRENIAYGLRGADLPPEEIDHRIREALRIAGLEPDIDSFPDGLQTVVGERGLSLSGGQRQRVALARALVSDRPLLVLDDSLSSVDADTEREILSELTSYVSGRSVVLISHRLSALQHADRVVVLEQGRVAELGTHRELLARDSLYAELYRRQLAVHDLEEST